MIRDDGEFVEDEVISGVLGRELGDQEIWRWILEGIRLRCFRDIFLQVGGFLCKCRAVAKLVLDLQVRTAVVGVLVSLTDIPAALTMDRCVEENTRCPVSRAAEKRLATRVERYSDSPNCIVEVEWR